MAQPAHLTKHIPLLVCPFNNSSFALSQRADGVSNGTALWLGGQCLAMYLAHNLPRCHLASKRPSAIELGSGIGFTACVPFISAFTRTEMFLQALRSRPWAGMYLPRIFRMSSNPFSGPTSQITSPLSSLVLETYKFENSTGPCIQTIGPGITSLSLHLLLHFLYQHPLCPTLPLIS